MSNAFAYVIGLGASVMMPVIFTVLGVCIGIKFSRALKSGLLVGVGFVGLGMRGPGAVNRFCHIPGVQIVALCDYEQKRAEGCQKYLEKAGLAPAAIYYGEKGYEELCKRNDIDLVQLTAQAMCLEEQYGIHIPEGAIFYGETRRRIEVAFSDELRSTVRTYAAAMHEVFNEGIVPPSDEQPYCRSCSLKDICMPETAHRSSASNYLKRHLYAETS